MEFAEASVAHLAQQIIRPNAIILIAWSFLSCAQSIKIVIMRHKCMSRINPRPWLLAYDRVGAALKYVTHTLTLKQNGSHFAGEIFTYISEIEKFCIVVQMSLKWSLFPDGPNDNK